jgi:hypothetical protein
MSFRMPDLALFDHQDTRLGVDARQVNPTPAGV